MCNFSHIKNRPIVVFGVGSIGERHINNLINLGFNNIYAFRKRNLPLRNINNTQIQVITTWNEVKQINPVAAFITTPTSLHIEQIIECVKLGINVFVEKPLSHTTDRIDELIALVEKHKVFVFVGYMMRFHPFVVKLKEIIALKIYGELISLQSKWGEYLPDWHPWEDYRTSYAARKELGGGVALTLSHDIDLANYLIDAKIDEYHGIKNTKSTLEVDVEAGFDLIMKYDNGTTANISLNFFEKQQERFFRLVFDNASIIFDYFEATLTIKKTDGKQTIKLDKFDRNDMFVEEIKYFFDRFANYSTEESIKQITDSKLIIKTCEL